MGTRVLCTRRRLLVASGTMSNVTTRLANDTPDAAVVRVRDENGVDHRIAIEKSTGEIVVHQYNEYPGDLAACSETQRNAIRTARVNARYAADEETDADVVRPSERPVNLRRAIAALEGLTEAEFVRYFREFYGEIEAPSASVPTERVETVATVCYLSGDRFEYVSSPAFEREDTGGWEYTNPADVMAAPDRDPDVCWRFAPGPLPVSFGAPFRSFLVDHLRYQIRDIAVLRGEPIPDDCRLERDDNPDVTAAANAADVRSGD